MDKKFGPYRLVSLIGEGGMGSVFEAIEERIGRRCAIKVLHEQFSADKELVNRFHNEAVVLRQIGHLGLVQIYDFGQQPDGSPYMVMELLQGETLGNRLLRCGRLSVEDVQRIGRQIAEVLAAAHKHKIIHRDLKPDNIMLIPDTKAEGRERVKVLDFGIAKLGLDNSQIRTVNTRADLLMGTPMYMSPEQCQGAATVDEQSDVYSLGVMLYRTLAGRCPFVSDIVAEVLAMHISQPPTPLRELAPEVPPGLAAFIERMLAKNKEKRPRVLDVVASLADEQVLIYPDEIPTAAFTFPATSVAAEPAVGTSITERLRAPELSSAKTSPDALPAATLAGALRTAAGVFLVAIALLAAFFWQKTRLQTGARGNKSATTAVPQTRAQADQPALGSAATSAASAGGAGRSDLIVPPTSPVPEPTKKPAPASGLSAVSPALHSKPLPAVDSKPPPGFAQPPLPPASGDPSPSLSEFDTELPGRAAARPRRLVEAKKNPSATRASPLAKDPSGRQTSHATPSSLPIVP